MVYTFLGAKIKKTWQVDQRSRKSNLFSKMSDRILKCLIHRLILRLSVCMLKDVQLPQNGTMMPPGTKRFALSSTWRHEGRSCCEQGYSGLQVTNPAVTCVSVHIVENTLPEVCMKVLILDNTLSELRVVQFGSQWACVKCRKCWLVGSFGCSTKPRCLYAAPDRPGTHSCSSGDPQGNFLPTLTF